MKTMTESQKNALSPEEIESGEFVFCSDTEKVYIYLYRNNAGEWIEIPDKNI